MEQGKPTVRMDKVNQVLELFNLQLGAVPFVTYFFNMLSEGIDEEQKKQFKALIRCDYGFSISTTA